MSLNDLAADQNVANEDAREDSDRLDWLDTLQHRLSEPMGWGKKRWPLSTDCHARGGGWTIYIRNDVGNVVAEGSGATIREAIDQAGIAHAKLREPTP